MSESAPTRFPQAEPVKLLREARDGRAAPPSKLPSEDYMEGYSGQT